MTDAMRRIHVAGCVSCPFMAQLDGEDGDHQDMGGNPCGDYCRFDIREPRLINDGARVSTRPEWCPLSAGVVIVDASGDIAARTPSPRWQSSTDGGRLTMTAGHLTARISIARTIRWEVFHVVEVKPALHVTLAVGADGASTADAILSAQFAAEDAMTSAAEAVLRDAREVAP